jgi:hypothetical protein
VPNNDLNGQPLAYYSDHKSPSEWAFSDIVELISKELKKFIGENYILTCETVSSIKLEVQNLHCKRCFNPINTKEYTDAISWMSKLGM